MMATTKTVNFINHISAPGVTGAQADARLDAVTLGGFRDALQWSTTRDHLLQSLDIMTSVVDSRKLLASFLGNRRLWTEFLSHPHTHALLAANVGAIEQMKDYPWSLGRAVSVDALAEALFNNPTALSTLGLGSLVGVDTVFNVIDAKAFAGPAIEWLYEDNVRATEIFDTEDYWSKVLQSTKHLCGFFSNATVLSSALTDHLDRFSGLTEPTLLEIIANDQEAAVNFKNHPNHRELITSDMREARRELAEVPNHPFRLAYSSGNYTPIVTDDAGDTLFAVRPWEVDSVSDVLNGTGVVYVKDYAARDNFAAKIDLDYYEWAKGPVPEVSLTLPFLLATSTTWAPMVSDNGRYVSFSSVSEFTLVDLTLGTILFLKDLTDIASTSLRSHCVDNAGNVYLGDHQGRISAFDNTGTLLWSLAGPDSPAEVDCMIVDEASSKLLVSFSRGANLYKLSTSTGSTDTTVPITSHTLDMVHGNMLLDGSGGVYLYAAANNTLLHIDDLDTPRIVATNSYIKSTGGKPYLSTDGFIYKAYGSSGMVVDTATDTVTSVSDATYWLGDPTYSGNFVGHPTHSAAFASKGGATPVNSDLDAFHAEWLPTPNTGLSNNLNRFDFIDGDLVVCSGNLIYVLDSTTGECKAGYRPPVIYKGTSTTYSAFFVNNFTTRRLCGLSAKHEQVFASGASKRMLFVNPDGTIRWEVNRDSTDTGNDYGSVVIHPDGYVFLVSGTRISKYSAETGAFMGVLSVNGSADLSFTFGDVMISSQGDETSYLSYLIDYKDFSTAATFAEAYLYSSATRIPHADMYDNHLVCVANHNSSGATSIAVTPFDIGDDTYGTTYVMDSTWLSSNLIGPVYYPEGTAYDPETGYLHVLTRNKVFVLDGWKAGLGSVSVVGTYDLETNLASFAPPRCVYGRPGIGNW